jgi:hypothetical protein
MSAAPPPPSTTETDVASSSKKKLFIGGLDIRTKEYVSTWRSIKRGRTEKERSNKEVRLSFHLAYRFTVLANRRTLEHRR